MLRRDSTQRSFFDQTLYDRLIEPGHFLKRLDVAVDFGFVRRLCRGCYAREVGSPAASPVRLFKILLLQFLYDISDRWQGTSTAADNTRSASLSWPQCLARGQKALQQSIEAPILDYF